MAQVDWLKDMKKNYKTAVIGKCSRRVQEAVENNIDIKDLREKKEVRNSIINETVACLLDIFGGVGKPGIAQMRELVSEMGFLYPAMFKEDESGFGYGLGGGKGITGLPNQMLDRYRTRMAELKKKTTFEEAGVVEEAAHEKKKGKKKLIYGIDNELWYTTKSEASSAALISKANDESSFEKREQVYKENRKELITQFRDSQKLIGNSCRGFFTDYRHLEEHFKVITNSCGLTAIVEESLKQQMGYLEAYLSHTIKTVDFADFLSAVEVACQAEYDGSFLYKYVEILRRAGDHFDKKGSVLVRLKEEPVTTDSPHIVAIAVQRIWIFEVWVDKMKLLENLTLAQAIASFLHLSFTFNLQYPKESQTVADLWQRKFAKYGDASGTRTHSKKDSALAKINKYMMVLGEILTQ